MRHFAALIARLECASPEARRIGELRDYLAGAPPGDAAWAIQLLAGRGLGRLVRAETLCESVCRAAHVERWMFDTCLEASGDIAETIAHMLPPARHAESMALAPWVEDRLLTLPKGSMAACSARALQWCGMLDPAGRELLVRLVLGRWRAMVDESLLLQALAQHAGIDIRLLRLRWPEWMDPGRRPGAGRLAALLQPRPTDAEERGLGYPFAALQVVDATDPAFADLAGGRTAWVMRCRRGTCRVQLVRRAAGVWLWSSSGELLNRRCADILEAATALPIDTVLEGDLLAGSVGPQVDRSVQSPALQQPGIRHRSKRGAPRVPQPGFAVTDLLELAGLELRDRPYAERLARACDLPLLPPIEQSPEIGIDEDGSPLPLFVRCRSRGLRGWLAMRRDARYGATQALLHGIPPPMRAIAAVHTAQWVVDRDGIARLELGLALWNRRPPDEAGLAAAVQSMTADARLPVGPHQLVPLARLRLDLASWGTAAETTADGLLEWIQEATTQRFGPVRLLRPDRICEVVFDDLEPSARRKTGLRLTAVRLQRWRSDCSLMDVDDVQRLRGLLAPEINT